ncbi:uncharacterized protein LOC135401004 [Ornithodoros turicata]|uniref:uncharacterized protein LOC135401004 n=1 Tax=Ornithodoros turicata TaxID=34597 RepID=UPI003138C673
MKKPQQRRSCSGERERQLEERIFKSALIKWYKQMKRSTDDEAQLLGAKSECSRQDEETSRAAPTPPVIKPAVHQSEQKKNREPQRAFNLAKEDVSNRKKSYARQQNVTSQPTSSSTTTTAQSAQQVKKTTLSPADRARMAFPGVNSQQVPNDSATNTGASGEPIANKSERQRMKLELKPGEVRSLAALLGHFCSGGRSIPNIASGRQGRDDCAEKGAKSGTSKSLKQFSDDHNRGTSPFPTSIEVLMTVNHSYSTPASSKGKDLTRHLSCSSVARKKRDQDVISIPKSRFILVSALLLFTVIVCFAVTIYAFSTPREPTAHDIETILEPSANNIREQAIDATPHAVEAASRRTADASKRNWNSTQSVAYQIPFRKHGTSIIKRF